LVDVLKICAPDAPFTPSQLKVGFSTPVWIGDGDRDEITDVANMAGIRIFSRCS
jgi:hypothetical protein